MTTRWRDNDVYGHLNNVVYYEYVDSAVNAWLREAGVLSVPYSPVVGLVVESGCSFHESILFPEDIEVGLRVARIGNSSVRYEVGLFRAGATLAAADAHFIHVYVDADSHRPVPLTADMRTKLEGLKRDR